MGTLDDLLGSAEAILEACEDGYKPTAAMAKAAERGLEARRKASESNKGGLTSREAGKQGIGSGVQRAVNIKNQDCLDLDTVKMMRGFFDRHKKNYTKAYREGQKPHKSRAIQADLLWGGRSGDRWSDSILKKLKGKKEAKEEAARLSEHTFNSLNFMAPRTGAYGPQSFTAARPGHIGVEPAPPSLPFRYAVARDVYEVAKDLMLDDPLARPEEIVHRALNVPPFSPSEISSEDFKLIVMGLEFLQNGFPPDINKSNLDARQKNVADWYGRG